MHNLTQRPSTSLPQAPHPRRPSVRTRALTAVVVLVSLSAVFAGSASALSVAHPTANPAATSASPRGAQFRSPSKNIICAITPAGRYSQARCDIHKHSFTAPPKPSSCHFDWGFSLEVKQQSHWNCVSDAVTSSPHVRTLPYGHSRLVGHVRCTSRRTAMVCHNVVSGHGFRLSKVAVTLF